MSQHAPLADRLQQDGVVSVAATKQANLGEVFDLEIRFGNQVRIKCVFCTCYMQVPLASGVSTCSRCHTSFARQGCGMFKVVSLR